MKKSKAYYACQTLNYLIMTGMMIIMFYPLWYVLVASLTDSVELLRLGGEPLLLPKKFNLSAYALAFSNKGIARGYMNTLFILVFGLVISMTLTSIGAYFLSRRNVYFKKPISMLIMFTMVFSGGLIPFYMAVNDIGMIGSLWSLIIPTAISTYNMIILRTGFSSIPDSLEESAHIDGAGHMTILWKIVLPLSKSTLAVIALYYAVGIWNAWFNASLFLQSEIDKWPLQLVLRQILISNDTKSMTGGGDTMAISVSIQYAVVMIATLPILCVYPFVQKYFVKGVMIGAVKG